MHVFLSAASRGPATICISQWVEMDVVEQLKYLDIAFDSKLYIKKRIFKKNTDQLRVSKSVELTVVNLVTYSSKETVKSLRRPINSRSEGFELSRFSRI